MKKILLLLLALATAPQIRAAEGDTALQNLSISGYELSPAFNSSITSYSVLLKCPVADEDLSIMATARTGIDITYGGAAANDGTLQIMAEEAGDHTVEVTATAEDSGTRTYTITIIRQLPETLLRRLWTDVIVLNLDSITNGGYNFTGFQWYKDGKKEFGFLGKYYHNDRSGLTSGSYYHIVLITSNGDTLQTCPYRYEAPAMAKIQVYPNPARQGTKLTVDLSDMVELPDYIEIFNSQGVLLNSININEFAKIDVPMNYANGVYVIKAGKYLQKILVVK